MQEELEKLKENLAKLEYLSSKLSFMLRELNYLLGDKCGQTINDADPVDISNSN